MKKTFNISGMHCVSCGLLVDDEIEEISGVTKSETSFKNGTAVVTYEGDIDDQAVITAIANAGYSGAVTG